MSVRNELLIYLTAVSNAVYVVASKPVVDWLAFKEPLLAAVLMILMFMYILKSIFLTKDAIEVDRMGKVFYLAVCANSLILVTGLITFVNTDIITTGIYKPFILVSCYVGLGIASVLLKPDFSQVFHSKSNDDK